MVFWTLAIALTAIACATLYYASGRQPVNAASTGSDAVEGHFRLQLREIESDVSAGRLGAAEALAAKGELAREVLRLEAEGGGKAAAAAGRSEGRVVLAMLGVAVLAFGVYSQLGRPDLPALPLAQRPPPAFAEMTLQQAVTSIETRLRETPEDLRGWLAIGPAYMQLGRFADAVTAFRRVNTLAPPTAESETNLAEAIMMTQGGSLAGEPLALLQSAVLRDPGHIRARFYLAGEATAAGRHDAAIAIWDGLLAGSRGDEAWLAAARQGRQAALDGRDGVVPAAPDIRAMVDGLAARLESQGGSVSEWTRLVRSQLVLGETEAAQASYRAARAAHPDAGERQELDILAADNGLIAAGSTP